jgi:hypothetical protein
MATSSGNYHISGWVVALLAGRQGLNMHEYATYTNGCTYIYRERYGNLSSSYGPRARTRSGEVRSGQNHVRTRQDRTGQSQFNSGLVSGPSQDKTRQSKTVKIYELPIIVCVYVFSFRNVDILGSVYGGSNHVKPKV